MDSVRCTFLQIDGGIEFKEIEECVGEEAPLGRDVFDLDIAVGFVEGDGIVGAGDDHRFVLLRRLLGLGSRGEKHRDCPYSPAKVRPTRLHGPR